jgi:small GTP-binding protein
VWDCSGAERYRPIIAQHYDGVKGVILLYDASDLDSFQATQYWHHEMLRVIPDVSMLLVGSKVDLVDKVKLSTEDGIAQAKEWGIQFVGVSAKTGQNCDLVLQQLLTAMKKPA